MPREPIASDAAPPDSPVLERILALGEPDERTWLDYAAEGFERAHEQELIRIATSPALRRADAGTAESWALVHAARALGDLGSGRAVTPLLDALVSTDTDDEWMAYELPEVFRAIGGAAVAPLLEVAADRTRDLYARMVAVESLGRVGSADEAERDACVACLTRLLQEFADEDPTLNAMVIGELVDLEAREAAVLMKAAFDTECVDLWHMGDWEDVQIALGMLTERITPRRRLPPLPDAAPLFDAHNLDATVVEALQRVVQRPGRSWGPKSLRELEGFLFAVACAPDVVPPSEWVEALIEDGEPFQNATDARDAIGALIALQGNIQEDASNPFLELPPGFFRDDLMANLEEDADVAQWSRGFVLGHSWLEEAWEASVPLGTTVDQDLGSLLLVLSFFAKRSLAERYARELGNEKGLEELAEAARKAFADALGDYAALGRTVLQARLAERERRASPAQAQPKPGRNDPCPCGSGKKYKKCCGLSPLPGRRLET